MSDFVLTNEKNRIIMQTKSNIIKDFVGRDIL